MTKTLIATALFATMGLAHAESATYVLDPGHTSIIFEVRHFGTSTNRGRFDKKEGTVTIDRAAKTGKAEITIDTASISTGVPAFDSHLKKKDFFDVAAFPSARFVSTDFQYEGDKVKSVAGMLTFLGKTQPVTLVASNFNCYQNPMLKREVCGGDFETTFKRSSFGNTFGLPGIPDDVRLLIQIEGVKQ